ncbi:hypothetical protein LWM68_16445 [Niabella sp. W65]|nr:hypothetical protein [Niabella sp. W65]MCH7364204.1 hypothetical protein [Niabella sp. W65]ULT40078.1 hypothetical protein KRR40_35295 [Niabella sp. I65]
MLIYPSQKKTDMQDDFFAGAHNRVLDGSVDIHELGKEIEKLFTGK